MNRARTIGRVLAASRSRRLVCYAGAGLVLAAAIALAGEDLARHTDAIDAWLMGLGTWGVIVFVGIYIVATSVMMPESLLSIMAGALFGLGQGLAAVIAGSLAAATLQYGLSQHLLRERIRRIVAARPSFAAIQQAVRGNELKLQVLLRLTPERPADRVGLSARTDRRAQANEPRLIVMDDSD